MKKCPKCNTELKLKTIDPVEVDECESCGGIWFDKGELTQAEEATDANLHWLSFALWSEQGEFKSGTSPRQCPVCEDTALTQLHYGPTGVLVDFCPSCRGTWLDKGEFQKIIDALEDELMKQPLSEYMRETLAEAKDIIAHPGSLTEWKDLAQLLTLMQYRLYVQDPELLRAIGAIQSSTPFT